jgi:hypothetical protein
MRRSFGARTATSSTFRPVTFAISVTPIIPAKIGGTPHAEIFFVGSESPLGVGENVAKQLRKALLT